MLPRRTLPEGSHPFTPKSPQPQKRWELSYEVFQNGERGILSLRSRLRCRSSRSLCSDDPSPEGSHPFTPKSPQPQKRWELSYEVSQNGERGILSLRSRLRCRSSRSLCSDEPSPEGPHPFTPKSPQPQKRWELSYEVFQNGERGIRTLAPLTQSNPLAEGPLIATWVSLQETGSPNRTRTCDNSINSRVLYQLSYQGTLLYGNTK